MTDFRRMVKEARNLRRAKAVSTSEALEQTCGIHENGNELGNLGSLLC